MKSRMRVLGLATYPVEAAATRYRLVQYVEPLARRGIDLQVRPFLDSRLFNLLYRREAAPRTAVGLMAAAVRRLAELPSYSRADLLFVQREAMLIGPPIFEWLLTQLLHIPMVLDLDDATYIPVKSPTYGRLTAWLKWPGKTEKLIDWAQLVTCGNRSIAQFVESRGARTAILPTIVNLSRFAPRSSAPPPGPVTVGWVGTHSTYPYLQAILPALQELAKRHRFRLRVVGSGRKLSDAADLDADYVDWTLQSEVQDFQSLDIGLYPLADDEWAAGKSGFKAVQYMAVGIPFVCSPVGACLDMGEAGLTHLFARTSDEWLEALDRLVSQPALRQQMGAAARRHAEERFDLETQADQLARILKSTCERV